jgi:predicted ester cyclase
MATNLNRAAVLFQSDRTGLQDSGAIDQAMVPDTLYSAFKRVQKGLEIYRSALHGIHQTFPDDSATIADVVTAGDRVLVRAILKGTDFGPAMPTITGDPSGDATDEWELIRIFRLDDGKIVEGRGNRGRTV